MTLEEIKEIIKQNPNLPYEDIQNQATQTGVDPGTVRQAWDEVNGGKKPMHKSRDFQYTLAFLVLGLILIEIEIQLLLKTGDTIVIEAIETIATFFLSVFSLFLFTMLLGSGNKFKYALQLSILFAILGAVTKIEAIALLAGPLFILIIFYALKKVYGMGILKSILVMILQVVFLIGIIFGFGFFHGII